MPENVITLILALLTAGGVFLVVVTFARGSLVYFHGRERAFARDLNELFLFDFSPRLAAGLSIAAVFAGALVMGALMDSAIGAIIGGVIGYYIPGSYVRFLRN